MVPTEIQKNIIQCDGNVVVLASPGSGKTFVLSEKIRRVLKENIALDYQGVIAISYTRKASANLKKRTLGDGMQNKNSFFGTIDNFCLTQIIETFGNYTFGCSSKDIEVKGLNELDNNGKKLFEWVTEIHPDYTDIEESQFADLEKLFRQGYVLVESLELLALHIIKNSSACQKYLQARYKYVFIDEFQDADTYTNELFLLLLDLGLTGIAVGDVNQSIYGFAHKDSIYLKSLVKNTNFTPFTLGDNFRCSIPIINYSNRLLDENCNILDTDKTYKEGMYLVRVNGSEYSIAEYLDNEIESIKSKWSVTDNSEIAILVKNERTQKIIDENLENPHRLVKTTSLDMDLNPKSRLYTLLLCYYFDDSVSFMSVLDEYVEYEALTLYDRNRLYEESLVVKSIEEDDIDQLSIHFKTIADILLPKIQDGASLQKLNKTLASEKDLESYKPMSSNEIQVMTLHKSKGLEFDVVFHLNMSDWELPYKKIEHGDFNNPQYPNWKQDINLHFVGITRARKACYLVRGTQRTNSYECLKNAKDSEFLCIHGLETLRKDIWYGF